MHAEYPDSRIRGRGVLDLSRALWVIPALYARHDLKHQTLAVWAQNCLHAQHRQVGPRKRARKIVPGLDKESSRPARLLVCQFS